MFGFVYCLYANKRFYGNFILFSANIPSLTGRGIRGTTFFYRHFVPDGTLVPCQPSLRVNIIKNQIKRNDDKPIVVLFAGADYKSAPAVNVKNMAQSGDVQTMNSIKKAPHGGAIMRNLAYGYT